MKMEDKNLEIIRKQFAEWYAIPAKERKIKTQKEFSERFGVSQATLSAWAKSNQFQDDVSEIRLPQYRDKVWKVWEAMYKKALNGSERAADMLFKRFDPKYDEKKEGGSSKNVFLLGGVLDELRLNSGNVVEIEPVEEAKIDD